jgi:hypothetical protein
MHVVEAAAAKVPAAQSPLQADDVNPVVVPYFPGGQLPLQLDVVRPDGVPKVPAGQLVQEIAAANAYCPVEQSPEQFARKRPELAP